MSDQAESVQFLESLRAMVPPDKKSQEALHLAIDEYVEQLRVVAVSTFKQKVRLAYVARAQARLAEHLYGLADTDEHQLPDVTPLGTPPGFEDLLTLPGLPEPVKVDPTIGGLEYTTEPPEEKPTAKEKKKKK